MLSHARPAAALVGATPDLWLRPMTTLFLVIHVMIAIALVGVVLLQRTEGGALGIGGGGGGGGPGSLFSGRGAASLLTRTTAVLAASFMATSIILAILASGGGPRSVLETAPEVTPVPPLAAPELPVGDDVDAGAPAPTPADEGGAPAIPVGD